MPRDRRSIRRGSEESTHVDHEEHVGQRPHHLTVLAATAVMATAGAAGVASATNPSPPPPSAEHIERADAGQRR
jgi:hypothetical protein